MPRVSSKDKYTVQVFELFKQYGLSLNMEQIAQNLGLTKKTLYNNFTSKQELISTVVNHFYASLECDMRSVIEKSGKKKKLLKNPVLTLYKKEKRCYNIR